MHELRQDGDHRVTEERLTLVSVLQELTVAAMDLCDPGRPMDDFLDRLAARLGCTVVLFLEASPDTPRLLGSAGLSRSSREAPLSYEDPVDADAAEDEVDWDRVVLPFPELAREGLHRWVYALELGVCEDCQLASVLMLYFVGEPRLPRQYRGMVERLVGTLRTALVQRCLHARTLEHEQRLREQQKLLRSLNAELERRVDARTRDLAAANRELAASLEDLHRTQDQLLHAGKMAAVGTLVAGLSHELNNPVCVILGYAQTLLERLSAKDPSRRALTAIERQAKRCDELLRALADFTQAEPNARERVWPGAVLERVRKLADVRAERKNVQLELMPCPDDLPDIQVCRSELESALLNLVNNSLDATPGGGRITLGVSREDARGRNGVAVVVSDTGGGITPENLPRVFDPFFTTKPVGQGIGLGLSLARHIVETHGGVIRIDSTPSGTTAHIWIPAADAVSFAAAMRSPSGRAEPSTVEATQVAHGSLPDAPDPPPGHP